MTRLITLIERIRALVRESVAFDRAGLSRKKAFLLYTIRLVIQVAKGLVRDKCLQQASSLAYKTVLSLVPSVAVALSLVKAFGGFEGSESAVVVFLSRHLLAVDPDTVAQHITRYTEQLSFGAIGGVGVAVLFIVAVSLLDTVERTLNDIWKSKVRRGLLARITTFYAIVTVGPLLLSLSLYETARIQSALEGAIVGRLSAYFTPVLVTWVMLLLCYKLFPSARVRWWPAMVGAALAAIGFEAVKFGFNVYVAELLLSNYNKVYGAIALVPLFLVWVYVAWIIVLFGAEYAYTLQNLAHLVREEQRRAFARLGDVERQAVVNEHLAIRAAVAVGICWDAGDGATTSEGAAAALGVPPEAAANVLARLLVAGFLTGVDEADERHYAPARPLDRIRIADIAAAFREGHLASGRKDSAAPVEDYLAAAEDALHDALRGVTLQDLVRSPDAAPPLHDPLLAPEGA